ncbi:hypothetical protein DM01DRAFT_1298847 [Hesseltinella vesiculosa]|uniref:DNA mismatch repair protein S5 domain-containing protein n=1 Tax=Hesseltinella vesiculosa TaxID=101127 RepID=A0A1X2GW10_9FUNG|nr:hypothetical protein DM01DRAFT_1298847 [Hesseltinella vesiculosa]
MASIQSLDSHTARRIHSGQVITNIESIAKELVENALDAKATSIEIKLMDDGLEAIEVIDNGSGISQENRAMVGKKHCTSKIACFEDLEKLDTFGFRGEAVNAICDMAKALSLTTKTLADPIAKMYHFDSQGIITREASSAAISSSGTAVCVDRPFYNLAVRRQLAIKERALTVKRIQDLVTRYGLSHPQVRFLCRQILHGGSAGVKVPSLIKPTTATTLDTIRYVFGNRLASMLVDKVIVENFDQQLDSDDIPLTLHGILPAQDSDPTCVLSFTDRAFLYINQRPINYAKSDLREITTMVKRRYKQALRMEEDESRKAPFFYLDIQTSSLEFDVNVEPDKSVVFIHHKERLLAMVSRLLDEVYGSFFTLPASQPTSRDTQSMTSSSVPPPDSAATVADPNNANIHIEANDTIAPTPRSSLVPPSPAATTSHWQSPPALSFVNENTSSRNTLLSIDTATTPTGNISNGPAPISPTSASPFTRISSPHDEPRPSPPAHVRLPEKRGHAPSAHQSLTQLFGIPMDLDPASRQYKHPRVASPSTSPHVPASTSSSRQTSSLTSAHATASPSTVLPSSRQAPESLDTLSLHAYFSLDGNTRSMPSASSSTKFDSPAQSPSLDLPTSTRAEKEHQQPDPPARSSTASANPSLARPALLRLLGQSLGNSFVSSGMPSSLNLADTLDTSRLMQRLSSTYVHHRQRFSKLHHLANDHYQPKIKELVSLARSNDAHALPVCPSFPASPSRSPTCLAQVATSPIGQTMTHLGLWLDSAFTFPPASLKEALADYHFPCTKSLDPPEILEISLEDPLCDMIVLLPNKVIHAKNDEGIFNVVTDRRLVANGLTMTWTRDPSGQHLVIRLTSIFALQGYGIDDLMKLLKSMQRAPQDQASLERLRPPALVSFLNQMYYNGSPSCYFMQHVIRQHTHLYHSLL